MSDFEEHLCDDDCNCEEVKQKHCEVCGETDCAGARINWTNEPTTELLRELTHTEALKESVKRKLLWFVWLTPLIYPIYRVIDRIGHITGWWPCIGHG
jgi:hypothetical protein